MTTDARPEHQAEVLTLPSQLIWCGDNLGLDITTRGAGSLSRHMVNKWIKSQREHPDVRIPGKSLPYKSYLPINTLFVVTFAVADELSIDAAKALASSPAPLADGLSFLELTASARYNTAGIREALTHAVENMLEHQVSLSFMPLEEA